MEKRRRGLRERFDSKKCSFLASSEGFLMAFKLSLHVADSGTN